MVEAIKEFKERKPALGVYAVRCSGSGDAWVGASRNLEATRNSCWFSLRMGGCREPSLQEAWNSHGEAAFTYETLEQFDDDLHPMAVRDMLKARRNPLGRAIERPPAALASLPNSLQSAE